MDKTLGDGQLEFVLRRKTDHELHEAEKLQRQKKSKLYGAQSATVSGMTIPPSLLSPSPGKAQVKVERKESVAQKIGSVSMANLGKVSFIPIYSFLTSISGRIAEKRQRVDQI